MKMNTIQRCFLIIIFLFLYFTCAITQNVSADPQYVIKEDVTGVVPKPSEGKAMVVFIRSARYSTGYTSVRIYDGEKLIGLLSSDTYFAYETNPGKHLFGGTGTWSEYAFLEGELLPGKTYYILVKVGQGVFGGTVFGFAQRFIVGLYPIKPKTRDWRSREVWLSECSLIEMTEEAYKWDRENLEKIKVRREKYYEEWLKETKKHVINPEDGI